MAEFKTRLEVAGVEKKRTLRYRLKEDFKNTEFRKAFDEEEIDSDRIS